VFVRIMVRVGGGSSVYCNVQQSVHTALLVN
jgi:hypothetical protein